MAEATALNDSIKTLSRLGMRNSQSFINWCIKQHNKGRLDAADLRVLTKKARDLSDCTSDSVASELWRNKTHGIGYSEPFHVFPWITYKVMCVIDRANKQKFVGNNNFTKVPASNRSTKYKANIGNTHMDVEEDDEGELHVRYRYKDEAKVVWRRVVDRKGCNKIHDALHLLSEYLGTYANPPPNPNPQSLRSKGIRHMLNDIANGGPLFYVDMPHGCLVW